MGFFSKFFHSFNPSEPGYAFMWVLLLAGVFSIAIATERLLFLLRRSGQTSFMDDIVGRVARGEMGEAKKRCAEAGNMAIARIVSFVLEDAGYGENLIRSRIDESILKVVPDLEKRTGYLATIGNVSTLIGLMGTIYGLILAFASVGKPGIDAVEKSTLLASGIAAAMNTTFMGLMVAIPSILLYALFKAKTRRMIDEIDEQTLMLANALARKNFETKEYKIGASKLKDAVRLEVNGGRIKVFADEELVEEIER